MPSNWDPFSSSDQASNANGRGRQVRRDTNMGDGWAKSEWRTERGHRRADNRDDRANRRDVNRVLRDHDRQANREAWRAGGGRSAAAKDVAKDAAYGLTGRAAQVAGSAANQGCVYSVLGGLAAAAYALHAVVDNVARVL